MSLTTTDYEDLKSYLLGRQPEAVARRLEERLLAEDDLFELAEATEAEILDACLRGELAASDCQELIGRLAASPAGRRRLAAAHALAAATAPAAREPEMAPVIPIRRPRVFAAPAARAALAMGLAAALAGLAVVVWQVHPRQPSKKEAANVQVAPRQEPAKPGAKRVEIASAPRVTPEAPHAATPEPKHRTASPPSPVLFTLSLATLRSGDLGLQELKIAPGKTRVELRLELEEGETSSAYEVSIKRESRGTIWGPHRLHAPRPGSPLVIRLPASALPQGTYEVEVRGVTGEGSTELVSDPSFRVVR